MKKWHSILLAAVGLVGVGFVYTHRQQLGLSHTPVVSTDDSRGSTELGGASGDTGRPANIVWQKVDRSADGFRVEMPTNQNQIQVPAYNESGSTDEVNMIFSNPDAETTFSVAWEDNPPVARVNKQIPQRTLEMARDGAVERTQTTLVSESANTTQGFPGREFTAKNSGGGVLSSRLIFAGSRLYMLTASFPSAGARRDKDVSRFFNSFAMTTAAKVPGNAGSGQSAKND